MIQSLNFNNILFLDVETVPQAASYDELPENMQKLWDNKAANLSSDQPPEEVYQRAGIYAEFGKIICVTVGLFYNEEGTQKFRLKSFFGHDEKKLLQDFASLLTKHYNTENHLLCAHNGKEFDFPYLCRRMVINEIALPSILNIHGKKPWEVHHLDTLELWKFGDWKSYTSLNLLANILGIPTPKDDIDGSQVRIVYYEDNDLGRIEKYCRKDVLTVAQLLLKFSGKPLIKDENITVAE